MNLLITRYRGSVIAAKVAFLKATLIFLGVLAAGYGSFPSGAFGTEPEPATTAGQSRSSSVIWSELLQKTPFPHTAPLPDREPTALDGTYTKFDPKKRPPVPCRRCPDYVPQGGIWKLNFDRGIFRILHEPTGWRSIGSFVIDGNRLQVFNDPCCMDSNGNYRWTLTQGRLNLQVIEDKCAIRQRAKNFTKLSWLSCQPPSMEAGYSGHWNKPPGCE